MAANTWTVSNAGAVTLNGTAIASPHSVSFSTVWNTDLGIQETILEVLVEATDETSIIEQALSVVPNLPSLEALHIVRPKKTLRSLQGDTINVAALSIVQQTARPNKEGV